MVESEKVRGALDEGGLFSGEGGEAVADARAHDGGVVTLHCWGWGWGWGWVGVGLGWGWGWRWY